MNNEEWKEYQRNLALYVDSAQYEYRQKHPSCFYCECTKPGTWSWEYNCQVTSQQFNAHFDSDKRKAKRKAQFCKYYFPRTDLSTS